MSVPNTTTFTLQDVIGEINPATDDLAACFTASGTKNFNSSYGAKTGNDLLEFRDYDHIKTSTSQIDVGPNYSTTGFTIWTGASTAWTVSDNVSWINILSSTSGTGEKSITIQISANTSSITRFGAVTVTGTLGGTAGVTVIQTGNPFDLELN